jgi:hypothetical protein
MAFLDKLTPKARRWWRVAQKAGDTIVRAARVQGQQKGIRSLRDEAERLGKLYAIEDMAKTWKDYGGIAFHIIASYPPDLGFMVIYGFQEFQRKLGFDPIPFLFKAIEQIQYLNLQFWPQCQKEMGHLEDFQPLVNNHQERARKAAKLLARELSGTALRNASAIFRFDMDPRMKPLVIEEFQRFNPEAAKILDKSKYYWLFTRSALLKSFSHLVFGK